MGHRKAEGPEERMQNVPSQQTFAEFAVDHVAPWSPTFRLKVIVTCQATRHQ
jgi:hypothetical protein